MAAPQFVLTLSCPDRRGIVAGVSHFLLENGCNITESAQFGDPSKQRFFLRTAFQSEEYRPLQDLRRAFKPLVAEFQMQAGIFDCAVRTRALILVSRLGHCLADLLYRHRIGAIGIEIPLIVSNHTDLSDVVTAHGIPFRHMPVSASDRMDQADALLSLVRAERIDLIILARYMQILPPPVCAAMRGRIINIHHSFLPSFRGARPYHQAHIRGVKLIGATAHYVTDELDEGPIIEQAVARVSHASAISDLVATGRDIESLVLARAVKWHAEHRILLDDNRTIVFN
ncbi:MAG: formyltetrahydrofolate deformylase [Alphaproteobacteria bacterium]|nr:formyltetrahydrofolate deformylase [Alphaproteobacteria bacterium]